MKKLLLVLLILPAICNAQKMLCKKIVKTTDRKKAVTSYRSPREKHITAIREFKDMEFFGLHLYLKCDHDLTNAKGITITLSDGTVYKEDADLKCQQDGGSLDNRYAGSGNGHYLVQGFMHLSEERLSKLLTKRIASVQLNEASALIPEKEGLRIKGFIKCLNETKP
ncbi:MAG: hypothetical protein V4649_05350 [Bacteroidota bacterium]